MPSVGLMSELQPAARTLVSRLRDRLVPAVLTPMSSDGRPCMDALAPYAHTMAASGVGGLAIWAHTGRGPYLKQQERRSVLRVFRETTSLPLVVGVGLKPGSKACGDEATTAVLRMAADAVDLGADALLVFPPGPSDPSTGREKAALTLHQRLADEFDLPLVLFQLHDEAGGFAYPENLVRDLLAMPHAAGLKLATLDSAIATQDLTTLINASFPNRLAVTGEDRMFGPSLMWGATSSLAGIAAAVPRLTLDVTEAWRRGAAAEFLAASQRLDRFAAVTFRAPMEGYVQRMMWAAEWEGIIPAERAHDRYGPSLPTWERGAVTDCLDALFPS